MKLLAVSGGPDSMLMLHDYRKKDIVVAHVNYHKRKDSNVDQQIVEDFCNANNIKLEILNVKQKPIGNFQSWARKIRYDFFKKIYDKYNCDQLLMAHHKDDFIETALMQQRSGRTPRFFGIKSKNELDGMNIYRPYLSYFKSDIIYALERLKIKYAIDSSNSEPIFERNKIRIELLSMSKKEKKEIYSWFKMSNKILVKKFNRVDKKYREWKESNYSLAFFRQIKRDKPEIVFEYVYDNFKDVKLSKKKIDSLIDFINGSEGNKTFLLSKENSVIKKDGRVWAILA